MSEWRLKHEVVIPGVRHSGWLPSGSAEPARTPQRTVEVWIEQRPDGYFLYTADGAQTFDSWHQSLQEAMDQASFQYGIDPQEWQASE